MISEAYLRRHTAAYGGNREIALLDVAQEYVLEYLRLEGVFDEILVFKGGTSLRKFVFGAEGRFSVDLDFGVRQDDPSGADLVLDLLDGVVFRGVTVRLERRKGPAAQLRLATPLGPVTVPAAISIRQRAPWLPPRIRPPMPFEFLDRGLQPEFARVALPVLDIREIAAEKIAAFRRRRKARDLYDLEHLGRIMQTDPDGASIAQLAALKIYFDVVEEGSGGPIQALEDVFTISINDVMGVDDLGTFRASAVNGGQLLAQCAQRYAAFTALSGDVAQLVTTCNKRDLGQARRIRDEITARVTASVG